MPPFPALVDLIGHLTTPVHELFDTYTTARAAEFEQTKDFLLDRPVHHIDFLEENLVYVNFIAQHPELSHNHDFKYDYQRFATGFDEITRATSIQERMTLIQDVKKRLTKVCTYLNDIDPAANIDMTPLNGGGEDKVVHGGEVEGNAALLAGAMK